MHNRHDLHINCHRMVLRYGRRVLIFISAVTRYISVGCSLLGLKCHDKNVYFHKTWVLIKTESSFVLTYLDRTFQAWINILLSQWSPSSPVYTEVMSSPSIKHNFSSYFINFPPAPFRTPSPFPWHLDSSTPLSLSDILWLWFAWQRTRLVYTFKSS